MKSGVALVTGSGRRLGRQIALALAGVGFDIVVHYNKSEAGAEETCRQIEGLGSRSFMTRADISDSSEVKQMVEESLAKFVQIDVLVNNAGVFSRGLWENIDPASWREVLAVNLTGTFLCTQAVGREMVKRGVGRIINLSSIGGIQAWPNHIPYSVSKSGVATLTRCFARALAPSVMVNAIAPGTIIIEGEEDSSMQHIPVERIPMKRYGIPIDITSLVLFLATSGSYVTGQVFTVDGGRSLEFLPT